MNIFDADQNGNVYLQGGKIVYRSDWEKMIVAFIGREGFDELIDNIVDSIEESDEGEEIINWCKVSRTIMRGTVR